MFLNLDAGELADESDDLWSLFDVLNCACGGHAGDVASMIRVAQFCARSATRLGAHPSYPDREHFGRRSIAIDAQLLARTIAAQCGALRGIADELGLTVSSMKPHGALYHDAARDPAIADAVLHGATSALGDVLVIGPPTGALRDAAIARGLQYAVEGFADRAMRADGALVPRSEPNALVTDADAAARQARSLASSVDTICVHADTPNALAIARAVREALA